MEETVRLQAYDIIGDVHGCADKLEGLLRKLGFEKQADAYRHPERQAIFVGDLIDRGPQQVETLDLVHRMVEAGSAQVVMGNHEFNAISYATRNPNVPDEFLRPHNAKNSRQHQEFLEQVPNPHRWIEWFKTMPLYLDLGGLRVVHACWNAGAMRIAGGWVTPGAPMMTEFLVLANQRGSDEYKAIEVLLKGPELNLAEKDQCGFMDKDGNIRSDARIRWWDVSARTLDKVAEIPPGSQTQVGDPYPELPAVECLDGVAFEYRDETPVFYGHYWRSWAPERGRDWTTNTACLDFSAVKGGPLVAYRWEGEKEISRQKFVKYQG